MSCFEPNKQQTLALPMDTRSPAGSVGRAAWVLVLNANTDLSGRMRRMAGWRRFGWQAGDLFQNQDLHDQLEIDGGDTQPCKIPTSVQAIQTGTNLDGSVTIGLTHNGAPPSRVRWYKDDVLIHDSGA